MSDLLRAIKSCKNIRAPDHYCGAMEPSRVLGATLGHLVVSVFLESTLQDAALSKGEEGSSEMLSGGRGKAVNLT